tara:strand:- start:1859 stop:4570 length:2712 start_codon:yes stop_codon:yes gene_type:complete
MLKKLSLEPGMQQEGTQYSAEGYWFDCDKIRFRQGRPEKIGGWVRPSSNTFIGTSRKLHNWSSINNDDYLGIGTNKKAYIEIGGVCYDVTPNRYKNTVRLTMSTVPADWGASGEAATDGATTIYTDGSVTDDSYLRVDNEYIKITGSSGSSAPYTLTVTRGHLGSTAASHTAGAAVFEIPKVSNPIGIVGGSSTVIIKDEGHGAFQGDYVTFLSISTDPDDTSGVGGITRSILMPGYSTSDSTQGWEVTRVLNSDYYEISVGTSGTVTGTTTLSDSIDSSTSTVKVSGEYANLAANDFVKIDNEYIKLVTKTGSDNQFTSCLRGQFGSSPEAHSSGAAVQKVGLSSSPSFLGGDCWMIYDVHAADSQFADGSGFGSGRWGGRPDAIASTTLDVSSEISDSATGNQGINGSTGFSSSGTVLINSELISYVSISASQINLSARGVLGTSASAHDDESTVYDVTSFWTSWGQGNQSSVDTSIRTWSLDNYGEDLILAARDGAPYYWNKSEKCDGSIPAALVGTTDGKSNNGTLIGDAIPMSSLGVSDSIINPPNADIGQGACPEKVRIMMVHPSKPIIVAFGCTDTFGTFDPLLIRWSDADRPGSWDVVGGNQAGGTALQTGSEIVSAGRSKREILIWTDEALYAMRYVGGELIFSFSEIASGVNIVAPNAYGVAGDRIFWMGDRNFYMYDGNVTVLPCSVLNYVFSNFDYSNKQKVFSARNSSFGEISWFYQSLSESSSDVDKYVTYNYIENSWAFGNMSRTSWSDSGIRQYPYASYIDNTNENRSFLYQQERGSDADGSALTAYVESGFIDIDDGDSFSFVSRVVPDIRFSSGGNIGMNIQITPRDFPNSSDGTTSDLAVTSSTGQKKTRVRGRQIKVRFESTSAGVSWTVGDTRIGIQPDGRR